MSRYDVVVIGSGPGGEGAAMTAAKSGKSVAIVDRYAEVGGGCVHWGTIPSKVLRHAVMEYVEFRRNPMFQPAMEHLHITFPMLLNAAGRVIEQQASMRRRFYERNDVRFVDGHARFVDGNTIEVTNDDGAVETIYGEKFIIAVGSSPYRPADVDFSHPRVLDADTVLKLDTTPHTVTIYGAGVIGCEYASIFRNLDVKLNLVNTRDKLLSFLDDEIIDALSYQLRDQGAVIRHNEEYAKVVAHSDHVELHLKSGKILKSEYLLWAQGRTGNTDKLGLENVGISVNSRRQIDVDENYVTSVPHIYAVGDVVGFPGLASASYDQGRFACIHAVTGECNRRLVDNMPSGIWTSPEISCVGPTEKELTEKQVPYEVGHALFRSLARAQIDRCTVGMLKILFHRETLEVLAIHCFGNNAAEIVHIGQAVMAQKDKTNSLRYFADTTFNYPTMAEAYRVAALNGLNRL
ncbi:MAG: Si-specific NAD(P)(+) transhydrogenase [bacterium]